MTPYRLAFETRARRELKKLTPEIAVRIAFAIAALADNPRPRGCLKLEGSALWRIRVGQYRVIYEVQDSEQVIIITRIDDRSDVYRK